MERTPDEEALYNEGYMAGYTDGLLAGTYARHERPSPGNVEANADAGTYAAWTLEEIRQAMEHIDELRANGEIPPLKRYVSMDWVKKDKRGKFYVASEEQLQEELAVQRRSSIDCYGNLVVDGEIVTRGWLQSFDKKDE